MKDLKREAYYTQKHHAKDRNIDWHFTYDSWLAWWGDDITLRGCQKGQLVMARHGDCGPYHSDNVRKATCEENIKEAKVGNQLAAKLIKTPLGVFDSRNAAAKTHRVNVSTIRQRLIKLPEDYFYLEENI